MPTTIVRRRGFAVFIVTFAVLQLPILSSLGLGATPGGGAVTQG